MPQTLKLSNHANDEEVHEKRANLSTKTFQIQLGDNVKLRLIDRVPELQ